MSLNRVSVDMLDSLVRDARGSGRRRHHRNLHGDYLEPCQRFLNAIEEGSYIRPHRHSTDPKTETLIALRGLFVVVCFADDGAVIDVVPFGTERYAASPTLCSAVEVTAGTWHTVLPLVPGAVLLEVKAGPFNPAAAKEFAMWAPEEDSVEAESFLAALYANARSALVDIELERRFGE